ncbi:guanine nucleotide-binding protein subunit gamma 1-like isoform X3 [Vigna umbellata]|uniref:guanine nucleotide-binding protein subunit gamma 1 isoform X2 n=1 Tax=Phaseolus angularis TaxID=3914 RepID=UPI000809AAF7|nr:guanine nucleotide-binding protein subunit gamma 1 isoform X2 [Vigna angularis]XP_047147996.1 guanine nucleotide-binding protein subunit gamma 1-like isoform X3 [Vigna umbellata]
MASETASSADEETVPVSAAGAGGIDKRGRHRILAELKRLDQDSKFLQEELEELEKTENVSTICTDAACYKTWKVGLIHYSQKSMDL